jgi:hypothetical protein
VGVKIPQGATIVLEIHYSTFHTEPITDDSRIGLHVAPIGTVLRERKTMTFRNEMFTVPAGDDEYKVVATTTLMAAQELQQITPHMHLLGTDFQVEVDTPNGPNDCFADFAWNFEHQNTYHLRDPVLLPAGTILRATCTYDNTALNPSNFNDPPIDVPAGRTSFTEMCQLVMGVVAAQ